MDNQKLKVIFIGVAFLIIAVIGIMRAQPELFSFLKTSVESPEEAFKAADVSPQIPPAETKPQAITLPAWGIVDGDTQFSDYAKGEVRGGIRVAGRAYEEKTFDGVIAEDTRVKVVQRVGDQYQVVYKGYGIWVPLGSVTLTGK